MSAKPKTLDVTIMGRTYKVACSEEEREALLEQGAGRGSISLLEVPQSQAME